MAKAAITTWADGDTLTGPDLTNEFANILQGGIDVISPATGDLSMGGNDITNLASATFTAASASPTTARQLVSYNGILRFNDGSLPRFNQVLHSVGQSNLISTTATETALYTFSIGAGYLGTVNKVVSKIFLRVGLLSGSSVSIKCYYGGTLGPTILIGNSTLATASLTICPLTVTLSGNTSTSSQNLMAEMYMTREQNNVADTFGSITFAIAQVGATAIDSTAAANLQVNVIFSSADAANGCDYLSLQTVLMG